MGHKSQTCFLHDVGDNNRDAVWIGFPIVALFRSSAGTAVEERFREYKWHARSSSRTQLTPLLLAHKNGPALKLSHLTNSETPSPTTFYPIAPTKTPSFSPTGFPTLSPTANRLNMTIERLTNVSGAEVFRDVTSPQYRAALYVADQDELMFPVDHPRLLQRYLLAVFYFAMDGDNWVRCGRLDVICGGDPDDRSWLVGRNDECTWQGVDCDASGVVRRLFFGKQWQGARNNRNVWFSLFLSLPLSFMFFLFLQPGNLGMASLGSFLSSCP